MRTRTLSRAHQASFQTPFSERRSQRNDRYLALTASLHPGTWKRHSMQRCATEGYRQVMVPKGTTERAQKTGNYNP